MPPNDLDDMEGGVKHIRASIKTIVLIAILIQVANVALGLLGMFVLVRAMQ